MTFRTGNIAPEQPTTAPQLIDNAPDTLLELTDTDDVFQPDVLWQTNAAGNAATQSNFLDGGVV